MMTGGGLTAQTGDIRQAAENGEATRGYSAGAGGTGPASDAAHPSPSYSSSFAFLDNSVGLDKLGWEIGRTEFEMFDWTGDGHADLLTIGDHGSPKLNSQQGGLMVFSGDGVGAWSVRQEGGTNWGYGGLAVRKGGIVVGMHHNNAASGCGSKVIDACLGEMAAGLGSAGETYGMFGIDYGDFDNDGDLDVGASSFGFGNGIQIYRRDPQTWVNVGISKAGNVDNFFDWADVNADGYLDTVAGADLGKVMFGDGKGGFTKADTGIPSEAWMPVAGDLNDDGYLDLAYIADGPDNSSIPRVSHFVPGTGGWADASSGIIASLNTSTPAEKTWQFVGITDADADGELDLLAAGRVGLVVFKGDGKGGLTRAHTWSPGELVWWYAFETGVDVDWNGLPDVVGLYEPESGNKNQGHFLRNTGTAATPGVLQYPRGGEKLHPGSVRTVRWLAQGSSVSLELSTTGKSGPWTTLGGGGNDGQEDWKVPQTPSKNCYIKLTAGTHAWVNARPFEIIGSSGPAPLVASVSAPNGGENLSAGSAYAIEYDVAGGALPATGKLELSTSGSSGPWTKITDLAGVQAGKGAHQWTVPATPTANAYVRLSLTDSSPTPQTTSDDSNTAFTIWAAPAPQPTLARADLTPSQATAVIGETLAFSAKAFDTGGKEMAAATFTWSLNGSVGVLTPNGALASLATSAAGSATVEVTATQGGVSKSASAAVTVKDQTRPALAKVMIEPASVNGKVGDVVTLRAKATDTGGQMMDDAEFVWSIEGEVGKFDTLGGAEVRLTLSSAGSGEVTVKATRDGAERTASAKVTVRQPFALPWDLILYSLIGVAALVGVGAAMTGYRRKKRREEQFRRQQWASAQGAWQGDGMGYRTQGWQ
jgi:hypothetical protein